MWSIIFYINDTITILLFIIIYKIIAMTKTKSLKVFILLSVLLIISFFVLQYTKACILQAQSQSQTDSVWIISNPSVYVDFDPIVLLDSTTVIYHDTLP